MANIVCLDPIADFNAYGWFRFPLMGLLYVATLWKQLGHKVEVVCETFGSIYDALYHKLSPQFIEKLRTADFLAISVMTATANRSYAIADVARRLFPRLKIIMGGPHVSFRENEALQHCDIVVKGEADSPTILEAALEASGILHCPDLIQKDLNKLPFPDFSLMNRYKQWLRGEPAERWRFWERWQRLFRRWVPILSSRGCPFNCSFCTVTEMYGRQYRFRDPENVVEEMQKRIIDGCSPNFFFYDDNIAANPKRTKEMAELIRKRIIEELDCRNLRIVAEARADIGRDDKLLRLFRLANVKHLFIGFESVNPQTLRDFNKKQTVDDIRYCVSRLRAHGIKVQGMFIIGGDNDTFRTLKETVAFARKTGIDTIQISILIPLPGTEVYEMLENEGRILTMDWSFYDGTVIVFRPAQMTIRQLQQAVLRAWQRFYLMKAIRHPKYILPTIIGTQLWERIHGETFRELARQFEG